MLRLRKKLDYVKVELFLISEVKGPINYKLELLKDIKIYLVFNIKYLKPIDSKTLL